MKGVIKFAEKLNAKASRRKVLPSTDGEDLGGAAFDYVITMGCGDECPFLPAKHREDWDIPDPKDLPMNEFIVIRNLIETKVKELLRKIENKK